MKEGRIKVAGRVVRDPGFIVGPRALIQVHDRIPAIRKKRYLIFHKPRGIVVSRKDERGRKTVYDFLPEAAGWVFPVGRLDRESEGLLILTNDTAFGARLTDPDFAFPRTYEVWIKERLLPADLDALRSGMDIGRGEKSRPVEVKLAGTAGGTHLEMTLTEGKNREIRRMFEARGKRVRRILRTRFGPFELASLKPGEWREFTLRRIPV